MSDMDLLANYGGSIRVAGRITGRSATADTGYPADVVYDAEAVLIDTANQSSRQIRAHAKTPDGGRPTLDQAEIRYAAKGDPCEFQLEPGGVYKLIVCTETLVTGDCPSGDPPIPQGSITIEGGPNA